MDKDISKNFEMVKGDKLQNSSKGVHDHIFRKKKRFGPVVLFWNIFLLAKDSLNRKSTAYNII